MPLDIARGNRIGPVRHGQHIIGEVPHASVRADQLHEHVVGDVLAEDAHPDAWAEAPIDRLEDVRSLLELHVDRGPRFAAGNPHRDSRDANNGNRHRRGHQERQPRSEAHESLRT